MRLKDFLVEEGKKLSNDELLKMSDKEARTLIENPADNAIKLAINTHTKACGYKTSSTMGDDHSKIGQGEGCAVFYNNGEFYVLVNDPETYRWDQGLADAYDWWYHVKGRVASMVKETEVKGVSIDELNTFVNSTQKKWIKNKKAAKSEDPNEFPGS